MAPLPDRFHVVCLCVLVLTGSTLSKKVSREKNTKAADGDEDSSFRLELEHALGEGEDFVTRGMLSLRSLKAGSVAVHFSQESLTNQELHSLKNAARIGENYFIRARSKVTNIHEADSQSDEEAVFVSTLISACSLVKSRLSDVITIAGDGKGNVIGLSITTPLILGEGGCEDMESHLPHSFNTSISLDNGTPGPVPDTQSFLQKVEREEREKKDGKDNQSFLQKYWMYILIGVVVFVMMSSQSGAGGQAAASGGGGGGGGGGGQ